MVDLSGTSPIHPSPLYELKVGRGTVRGAETGPVVPHDGETSVRGLTLQDYCNELITIFIAPNYKYIIID